MQTGRPEIPPIESEEKVVVVLLPGQHPIDPTFISFNT